MLSSTSTIDEDPSHIFSYYCFTLLSSWFGIAFSSSFIEALFFLEILYLSILILTSIFSIISNNPFIDLFLIFILFYTICDSILGLILILISFKIIKNILFNIFIFLNF
jgi:hypothetical protein